MGFVAYLAALLTLYLKKNDKGLFSSSPLFIATLMLLRMEEERHYLLRDTVVYLFFLSSETFISLDTLKSPSMHFVMAI